MPDYIYSLTNGKHLVLSGEQPPSDAEVEQIAKQQGVSLVPAGATPPAAPSRRQPTAPTFGGKLKQGIDAALDQSPMLQLLIGGSKKAAEGMVGAGRLVHKIPGVSEAVDKLYSAAGVPGVNSGRDFGEGDNPPMKAEDRFGLAPTNRTQQLGGMLEQGMEYGAAGGAVRGAVQRVAPRIAGRVIPAAVADAASSAGVAATHGDDPKTAAAVGAVMPVLGAGVQAAVPVAKRFAVRMAQGGIKPTITALKEMGGTGRGLEARARHLAEFAVRNRLSKAADAQALVDSAESDIQSLVGSQPTTAPARAVRYLDLLKKSAGRQALGRDQVATIGSAKKELLEGSMAEDVLTPVTTHQPTGILDAQGQPITRPVTEYQMDRALRQTVPADETLRSARESSKWSTRRAWGEQKGAAVEAAKAVERAQRDAVKRAVPATRPIFNVYSKAIKVRDILDRMAVRQGNRDVIGFPAQIVAGQEMAAGKPPVIAIAANWLRSNQLKSGIWIDRLAEAVKTNNAQQAAAILSRLGVATVASRDSSQSTSDADLMRRAQALQQP